MTIPVEVQEPQLEIVTFVPKRAKKYYMEEPK